MNTAITTLANLACIDQDALHLGAYENHQKKYKSLSSFLYTFWLSLLRFPLFNLSFSWVISQDKLKGPTKS